MLTPGLEKLIQQGKAKYNTWSLGASGFGTIPVPENQFIIIVDFDYFSFLDAPPPNPLPPAPAEGSIKVFLPELLNPVLVDIQIGPFITLVGVLIDTTNAIATALAIQTALDLVVTGWVVNATALLPPGTMQIYFTTTTPGAFANGWTISMISLNVAFGIIKVNNFVGGNAPIGVQDYLDRSIHQVEFKSTKGRNHYIFRDDLELGIALGLDLQLATLINCRGMFHRDCYLVHNENVQVDILTVPPVSKWGVNYSNPPAFSQEFKLPSGYGQGAIGFPGVREVVFDLAGLTQQYYTLTRFRDNLPPIPGEERDEFKVDVNIDNKLNNPTTPAPVPFMLFNGRNYPILNIGYVLVNMNYNQFVDSSNG